jgi:hypothetical protein
MFIDVTRYGADHTLRLAPAAIAYLAPHPEGTIVKFIGGESLHVAETREALEAAIEEASFGHLVAGELRTFDALPPAAAPDSAIAPIREMVASDIFPDTGGARPDAEAAVENAAAPAAAPASPKAARRGKGRR